MATVQDIEPGDQVPVSEEDLASGGENPRERGENGLLRVWKFPSAVHRFLIRKPVFLAVAALLVGAAASWGFLESPARKTGGGSRNHADSDQFDGLHQNEMGRFYIPLPKDSPDLVLVVDSAVVCDALSAVRFKKSEVSVRDRIYDSLSTLAAKNEGLKENTPLLEEAISKVLKEATRAEALTVKVREVKVY